MFDLMAAPRDGSRIRLFTEGGGTVVGYWGCDDEECFWLTDVDDDPRWPHGCADIVEAIGWLPLEE